MSAVVTQIDHVLFEVADPLSLHVLLVERLGLPAAWAFSEMGPFSSGGVVLGNANLELLRWAQGSAYGDAPAPVRGIAFQPAGLDDALAELGRRGIAPDRVTPFERIGSDGERVLLWTNVMLAGHLGHDRSSLLFLCQYAHDMDTAREARRAELARAGGGALGVRRIAEILVGTRDTTDARRRWGALLAPHPEVAPGTWSMGTGPRLSLVAAPHDRVLALRVAVSDLETAGRGLADAGIAARRDGAELALDLAPLQGVDLRLVATG